MLAFQGVLRALSVLGLVLFFGIRETAAIVDVELVTSNRFSRPVFVSSPPGDTNRLFVLEQHSGRIRILNLDTRTVNETNFLRIAGLATGNEQGLLGLAFHPNYRENGYFYVNITVGGSGRTEIRRYQAQGDPLTSDVADPASVKLILTITQPEANHNGGWTGFGPDGYLYISTGDGGGGDDRHGPIGNAQNRANLLGKILRIDVDNGDPYAIPDGNPYKGSLSMANEIWAFGLRNPWRCSFDRETGDLWIGDVGQNLREEIDLIPAGVAGLNFGWRPREGSIQNPSFPNEPPVTDAVDPVFDYPRSMGFSVTGGYVYRGAAIPELQGKYIFGDYGSAHIWLLTPEGTNGTAQLITSDIDPAPRQVHGISSFGEDAAGELYICDLRDGQLFKIVRDAPPATSISVEPLNAKGSFVLAFTAFAGQEYVLESNESLATGSAWTTLTNITSDTTDRTVTLTNAVTGQERYFRLRLP